MINTLKTTSKNPSLIPGKNIKSFILRMLIHIVGDLHQPLHTITRIT